MKTYYIEYISDNIRNTIEHRIIRIPDNIELLNYIREYYGIYETNWRLIND